MMSNLQGGITSSQLSPQAYKNSRQNSSFQDTYNSQNASSGSNQSLLYVTPSTTTLKVEGGQSTAVLSASITPTPQNTDAAETSNNYVPVALVVLVISVGLAVYFFRKYMSVNSFTEAPDSTSSEE